MYRFSGRLALAWGACAVVLVACGAWADGARAGSTVRIVSPKQNSLERSKVVRVRVRVHGRVARVSADVYAKGRQIHLGRFRSPSSGRWKARLRVRRGMVGANTLYVRADRPSGRSQYDVTRFTVARRSAELLSRVRVSHHVDSPVRVRLRVRDATRLRVRLNGHNVAGAFDRAGNGRRVAELAAQHRLRFGANRLTVTAFDRRGRIERVRRRFSIRDDLPLAGAGRDRVTQRGRAVRLDGSSTRPARDDERARLRWRIVRRPKGSKARLQKPRAVRPRLMPDRPGRYVVRLRTFRRRAETRRARGQPASAREAAHARRAPATAARARATAVPSASDTVTVTAQPQAPPEGVPIETIVDPAKPGVKIGDKFYAMPDATPAAPMVQLLVLDRATLTPASSVSGGYNQSFETSLQGLQDLASVLGELNSDDLVILSGNSSDVSAGPFDDAYWDVESEIADHIGATDFYADESIASGRFSAIGVPGLPEGQAFQLLGRRMQPNAPEGAMSGVLRLDTSGNYTFDWPTTFMPVATQGYATTSVYNVISLGSGHTSRWFYSHTEGEGFHLVWLDADTLELRGEYTFPEAELSQLADQLETIDADSTPALIILSSVGKPSLAFNGSPGGSQGEDPPAPTTARLVGDLERFGANASVLLGIQGNGSYALVGRSGLKVQEGPNAGAEFSEPLTGLNGAGMNTLLTRDRQGLWRARATATPKIGTYGMFEVQKLLAEADQPFEPFTGAQAKAESYIAGKLSLDDSGSLGIRTLYWTDDNINWDSEQEDLVDLRCPSDSCPTTAAAFTAVKDQLASEFADVATVRSYFTSDNGLKGIYQDVFTDSSLGFTAVSGTILKLYKHWDYENRPHPSRALGILDGLLGIAEGIGDVIPGSQAVESALHIAGGVSETIAATARAPGGGTHFASALQAKLPELGSKVGDAWMKSLQSLDGVADLIVSDAGRLATAAKQVGTPASDGGWGLDSASKNMITERLEQNVGQYLWYAMLPVGMSVYECANGDMGSFTNIPGAVLNTAVPYRDPDSGWGVYVTNLVLGERDHVGWPQMPPSAITDKLFGDPDSAASNVGFYKQYFLAAAYHDPSGKPRSPGLLRENNNLPEGAPPDGWDLIFRKSSYRPECGRIKFPVSASWGDGLGGQWATNVWGFRSDAKVNGGQP